MYVGGKNPVILLKKEKETYSLASNIYYIYKILFRRRPIMVFYIIMMIVFTVSIPLIHNMIPAMAVDSIVRSNNSTVFILRMLFILFLYGGFTFLNQTLESISDYYIGQTQNHDFLLKLLMKSLRTDYENVEPQSQQRMINKASHSVNMYRQGVNMMYYTTPSFIANIIGLLIYATTITIMDYRILLVIVVGSFLGIYLEYRARKVDLSYKEEQYCIWGRFYYLKRVGMSIEGAKDIRIYGMKDWIFHGFMRLVDRNKRMNIAKSKGWLFVLLADNIMSLIRDLLAYGILLTQVVNGRLSLAEFLFALGIVSGISTWIRSLRNNWSDLLNGNIMLRDFRAFEDMPNQFLREGGLELSDKNQTPPRIEFRNVSFQYEESATPILKNLNFTIEAGENIALVGHNGAGKTTLVKLLCGLYHVSSGEILVNGHPIESYNLDQYHQLFSTIFQETFTLPLSILSNVSGVAIEQTDVMKARDCLRKSGLWDAIDRMKEKEYTYLTQTFHPEGIELSGGMVQKLMLARAMYKDAPIMVLDEPTAALDPIAESMMYEEYKEISDHKTSIFISHRLASTKFCDRIIYLEDGEIVEEGTHDELLTLNKRYAEVFGIQSQYYKEQEDH